MVAYFLLFEEYGQYPGIPVVVLLYTAIILLNEISFCTIGGKPSEDGGVKQDDCSGVPLYYPGTTGITPEQSCLAKL